MNIHGVFVKWLTSEPVRVYLYTGVIVPVVGLLVAKGVLDGGLAQYILAGIVGLLGPAVVETVRSGVSPATPKTTESPPESS